MNIRNEVEAFLKEFIQCAEVFGLIIINREKNQKGLLEIGITPHQREEIIFSLQPEDYYRGPNYDPLYECDVWEFGKKIDIYSGDIYIKLSTRKNKSGKRVCLSFHPAEFPINYPLKGGD